MVETINMPKLGFDMAEGTLVRWVKKVGENVNKGEVLAEIETDKATFEVESPVDGTMLAIFHEAGSEVPVLAPIAVIGAPGEKVERPPAAGVVEGPAAAHAPEQPRVVAPREGGERFRRRPPQGRHLARHG